jgi:protein-S-isoprenylcysteine O-methyltransferase Ste14
MIRVQAARSPSGPSVRRRQEGRSVRLLLALTLVTQGLLVASLALTRHWPALRVWPPPARRSWQFYFTWIGAWVHLSGAFLLAILDWNSLGLDPWLLLGVGLPLVALGQLVIFSGFRALSLHATLGLGGPFVRSGPYRWSRNPQYVGACVYLAGLAIASGSLSAIVACLGGMVWYLLAPFGEEPWLRRAFGTEYEAYCREVPRYVGRPAGGG